VPQAGYALDCPRGALYGGFAERLERGFELSHQDVRGVAEFPASLHEALCHFTSLAGIPAPVREIGNGSVC